MLLIQEIPNLRHLRFLKQTLVGVPTSTALPFVLCDTYAIFRRLLGAIGKA